jgi:tetratricopeptide (TPR) repeat protein
MTVNRRVAKGFSELLEYGMNLYLNFTLRVSLTLLLWRGWRPGVKTARNRYLFLLAVSMALTGVEDAYQPLYHLKKPNDCAQIVQLCTSKIIPMAETSKFNETRNKFLFLANRDIAGCEMQSGQYQDAENRYHKLFEYMPVWPGISDSDYPINYRAMGTARLMQGRWKDAEEPLEKSIQIFDEQIERALHSDSEFMRNEHSKNLKMSQAQARNLLAAAYFRDGRQNEALEMIEKAYQEAILSNATPEMIQQIIESGRTASAAIGDAASEAKWEARTTAPN